MADPIKGLNQTGLARLLANIKANFAQKSDVPSKTSDLTNDSGFLTSAPVTSVNGQTGAVTIQTGGSYSNAYGLAASAWNSSNAQSIPVSQVTSNSNVIVSPRPDSFNAWADAGIHCTAQSNGWLTFQCSSPPSVDITVLILIVE